MQSSHLIQHRVWLKTRRFKLARLYEFQEHAGLKTENILIVASLYEFQECAGLENKRNWARELIHCFNYLNLNWSTIAVHKAQVDIWLIISTSFFITIKYKSIVEQNTMPADPDLRNDQFWSLLKEKMENRIHAKIIHLASIPPTRMHQNIPLNTRYQEASNHQNNINRNRPQRHPKISWWKPTTLTCNNHIRIQRRTLSPQPLQRRSHKRKKTMKRNISHY